MIFNHLYPYTDAHELNLDWILRRIQTLTAEMEHFEAINEITYCGAWSITESYTTWSVVTNGTTGYLSKQLVPAGIAITNTDYWVVIDDFTSITALTARVDALEAKVSPLVNRKYLFIGDSFGAASSGWIVNLVASMGLQAGEYYEYAEGGIGYCQPGNNSGLAAKDALAAYLATLTADDIASITDVVVILGENDVKPQYVATVNTEADLFFDYVESVFPNLIRIVTGANLTYLQPGDVNYGDRSQYKLSIRRGIKMAALDHAKVCYNEGIEFSIYCTAFVEADGIHPDATGYKYFTRAIIDALNGAEFENYVASTQNNINFVSGMKECRVQVPGNQVLFTGAITLAGGAFTQLTTWTNLPFYPTYGKSIFIPLSDVLIDGTHYHNMALRIVYSGIVQIYNPNPAINVSTSIGNVIEANYIYDARQ